MIAAKFQVTRSLLTPSPALRGQVLRMSTAWAALGAVMGASFGMDVGGLLGAVAGMLVGCSELASFGLIFALIGGRPRETILGAVGGTLGGLAVGMTGGHAPVVLLANVGLFVGALVGSTLHAQIRALSLPVLLLGQIRRRPRRMAVIALPVSHPGGVRGPLPHGRVVVPRADGIDSRDGFDVPLSTIH